MATTRDIKRRIKAIENTRQITRAMEMVAATKMRRAQAAVLASRAYAEKARELLAAISNAHEAHDQSLLAKRPVKRTCYVVVTSDRGLCGVMNANVVRTALAQAVSAKHRAGFVTLGRRGMAMVQANGQELAASFTGLADTPHYPEVLPVAKLLCDDFIAGQIDEVVLVFAKFVSTLNNEPTLIKLLPIEAPEAKSPTGSTAQTLFEPSPETVLESLLPRLIEIALFQALLETKASEHAARMMAMRNASDNASDLLDDLTLSYNQARQAAITGEIAEIVSGAEALA